VGTEVNKKLNDRFDAPERPHTLNTATTTTHPRFRLLVGPGGNLWRRAAEKLGLPVDVAEISAPQWSGSCGMLPSGAILIGPDDTVALRQRGLNVCIAPPELALFAALATSLRPAPQIGDSRGYRGEQEGR